MTRWHASTGQRRRTYRVSGCIASAFARPVVCSLLRCQSARGLCCCGCVPSPAAQCNACQKAISQSNQSSQFPSHPRQHSVSLQLVFLHSLPGPHNRWSLVPKRTGKKAAGPRSSHVHRHYPIGGTLGICLGKLKDTSGSTKQLLDQLASSQARRHAGGIHWPMAHASASTPSLA